MTIGNIFSLAKAQRTCETLLVLSLNQKPKILVSTSKLALISLGVFVVRHSVTLVAKNKTKIDVRHLARSKFFCASIDTIIVIGNLIIIS